MPSSFYNKVSNITFNVKGFAEITKYQNFLVASKKKELDAQRQIVSAMSASEKGYSKQVKIMNRLDKELAALEKEALKFDNDMNAVRNTINDLGNASPKAINKLNSVFARMSKNTSAWSDEARKKFQDLLGVVQPVTQAIAEQFKKGFANMMKFDVNTASWSQLNNYVQQYNKNGRELAQVAQNEASAFAKMGQIATNAKIEMGKLDGTLVALKRNASPADIQKYMNGWKSIAEFTGASASQIKDANNKIAAARAQLAKYDMKVVSKPNNFAPREVEESTQRLKEYVSTTKLSASEQQKFNAAIKAGGEACKQMNRNANLSYMTNQFKNIKNISNEALSAQKTYWTEMMNGAKYGSAAYNTYASNLQKVVDLETKRANAQSAVSGAAVLKQYQNGAIGKSASELQRSVDILTKWRSLIDSDKSPAKFEMVSNAIRDLNSRLVEVQENVKLAQSYMNTSANTPFRGTVADLQKIKIGLMEMRKNVQGLNPTQIQAIDDAIIRCDNDIRTAGINATTLKNAINNPKGESSLKVLEAAYAKLETEIKRVGIKQEEFNNKAAKMRDIKSRIDSLSSSLGKQGNLLSSLGINLKNIILHYVGLNMIIMRIINTFKGVFQLSDQMANVQKVTRMTTSEVIRLVDELQAIDSRTDTSKLMEFAEQAGKLGIYAKQGVQGMKQFAEMGERIQRTLGEDAGGAQAIADLVKINDILGTSQEVLKRTGNATTQLRDALDATGSAILNVGNNSAASYGSVMNYVSRLGAIGSTVHMSVQEIIALGGALDALKMPAEAGSTAMSQFIAAIQRRTDEMARAAKLSVVTLRELASSDMMGAIKALIGQVKEGKASAQDLMDAMSGRSRTNVNIRNVINLLSGHIELLNDQLRYANEGFDSAFGSRTAENIRFVMSVLSDNGINASFKTLIEHYQKVRNGEESILLGAKKLAGSKHDVDMLTSALESVFGAMDNLKKEGNLTEESIKSLGFATSQTSVMEMEFARVNENAAGEAERLGNMIRENFVNSNSVEFFHDITNGIMRFILWMQSGELWARTFGAAMAFLTTAIIAAKSNLTLFIEVQFIGTIQQWGLSISALITKYGLLGATINLCKLAWIKFKAVLSANWVGIIVAGFTALVYMLKSAADEASRFAKMTQEVTKGLSDEIRAASALFAQLKNVNLANSERSSIISQINNKYGTLIGYMLQESATARQLANAYDLVVMKLKQKAKAQLQSQLLDKAQEDAADDIADAGTAIAKRTEKITKDVKKQAEIQTRISALVNEKVANNPNGDSKEMMRSILKTIASEFELSTGDRDVIKLGGEIKDLINGIKAQVKATERVSAFVAGQNMADERANNKTLNNNNKQVARDLNKALKDAGNDITKISKETLERVIAQLKVVVAEKDAYKIAAGNNNVLTGNIDKIDYWFRTFKKELERRDPNLYGKSGDYSNVEKMDNSQLRAAHANAKTAMSMAKDGVIWSAMGLDIPGLIDGMTEAAAREIIDAYDESLQEQAKKRHINLEGDGFNHGSHREKKKPEYEESDSALAELDRYYSWLDEQEKARLAQNEITQAEYDRRQLNNEAEHLKKRADLRAYFNGEDRASFISWWNSISELDSVSWNKINSEWAKADDKKRKENMRSRQKDLTEVQSMYANSIQEINKLLLDNNPTAKVLQTLTDSLDNLGLLTGNMFKDADIIQQLRPIMRDINTLTEKELLTRLRTIPTLADILTGDDDTMAKKLQAYILKLSEGNDEYISALRKEANQEKKRIDFKYDSDETKIGMTDNLAQLKNGAETASNLQSLNMGSDVATSNAKLKVAQQEYELAMNKFQFELKAYDLELKKIEALLYELRIRESIAMQEGDYEGANNAREERAKVELQYEEMKQKAMFATEETRNTVIEKQRNLDEAEHEVINNKLNYLKEYMSGVEQFGTSMTDAAFGSKEDRQNAAKELLKSVLETTKKIMLAKLQELIFEKAINQQKVAANQTMNAQITSQAGSAIMTQMTGTVAQAGVDTAAGIASGGAKTVGQMGVWGIPLIAVISAVLGALIAAVMAQFNKSKSQVAATTGKMSTGMLTYAEGRYPTYADGTMNVMGNDGRNYNAVVKPNLTTGEYNRPHLGIVGERGAELIVDHPTFARLKEQAPWILKGIYDMKRFGTATLNHDAVNRAMRNIYFPTHAQGNINQVLASVPEASASEGSTGQSQLQDTLDRLALIMDHIDQNGVRGHFNVYGDDGLVNSYDKGKKFLTSVGK